PKKHYRANTEAIEQALKSYFEAVSGDDPKFDYMGDFGKSRKSKISKVQDFRKKRKTRTLGNSESPIDPKNSAQNSTENSESPPPTPAAQPEPSEPDSANGGGDEKVLSPVQIHLAENGVNPQSWSFADGWSLEELQVITDRTKEQPGLTNPGGWIVKQLQTPEAQALARLELDTRKNAPPETDWTKEFEDREFTPIERQPAIPPFEPIIHDWKDNTPAPDKWTHGVLPAMLLQFHKATFNSWLKDSQVAAYEGDHQPPTLTIVPCNAYAKDWLETRMIGTVEGIAKQHFGEVALRFIAPAEIEPTLATIRQRIQDTPEPKPLFVRGSGWIGRDGDEQLEDRSEPTPPVQEKAQDSGGSNRLSYDPATLSPAAIWDKIYRGLRHNDLNRHQSETYLSSVEALGYVDNEIYVQVGAHALREFRTHLKDKVNARISKVTRGLWRIRFVTRDDADRLPENLIKLQEAV
ncbi:MAG TPA: hypothetical protein VFY83_04500, partial [Anaerolineales bacterium]|nr:hypothetical protein [Anaerolineales bacterium]